MAMTKIKGLQQWCRKMTEGYRHVDIVNFTTAWRDGMAFCAIIHRFRPDLIDYDSLSPENVFDNCKLAFEVAERELDIPAFLEAEDMARLKVPDKLSVITYVSQYYNFLNSLPQLGGPGVKANVIAKPAQGTKRPPDTDTSQAPSTKKAVSSASKENAKPVSDKGRQGSMGDKCTICQNRVYLLERHIEAGKLYHRSCFRHSELSPTNKVYTRSPFLSPSLSSEAPLSPTRVAATGNAGQKQEETVNTTKLSDKSGGTGDITVAGKRTEGAGTKHSLAEPDRDDSKKSKVQPKTLFGADKLKNASVIKERLENLKTKYTVDSDKSADASKSAIVSKSANEKDSENVLPLSSKEACQLQKRRDEILASEKAVGETKSAKRNVPLVFQQKDNSSSQKVSGPAEKVLPSNKITATTMAASAASVSTPINTKSSIVTNTEVTSALTPTTSSRSDTVSNQVKDKLSGAKDSSEKYSNSKPSDPVLQKKNVLPDVQSLQKMFSSKPEKDSGESSKSPHPVARPRCHKPATEQEPAKDQSFNAEASETQVHLRTKDSTPKPAPRKSMVEPSHKSSLEPVQKSSVEPIEKWPLPQRPKAAPQLGKSSAHSNLLDDKHEESPRSGTPPPLLSSAPPPLPTCPPPPLPPTDAVGDVNKVLPITHEKSSFPSKNVHNTDAAQQNKGANDSKTVPSVRKSHNLRSNDSQESNDFSKVKLRPVNAQIRNLPDSQGSEPTLKTTPHAPVKSQTNTNTSTPSDRQWSSPAPSGSQPLAVFVVPTEKKDDDRVLTGLLASLAGVRGRAASTPGSADVSSKLSKHPLPSAPASTTQPPDLAGNPPSSSKASTALTAHTSTTPSLSSVSTHHVQPQPSVSSISSHASDTTKTHTAKLPTDKPCNSESSSKGQPKPDLPHVSSDIPEALSVLNSLRHVGDPAVSDAAPPKLKPGGPAVKSEHADEKSESAVVKSDVMLTKPKALPEKLRPDISHSEKLSTSSPTPQNPNQAEVHLRPSHTKDQKTASDKNTSNLKEFTTEHTAKKSAEKENERLNKPAIDKPKVPETRLSTTTDHSLSDQSKTSVSSKEAPSHMNNVKLRRVLPEPKDVKKVPPSPVSDAKLKKVYQTMEEETKDLAPARPPRLSKKAMNIHGKPEDKEHNVNGEKAQNEKSVPQHINSDVFSSEKVEEKKQETNQANNVPQLNINTQDDGNSSSDDTPRWMKALEERKKKLRQDIANSESETIPNIHFGAQNVNTERPKSVDVLSISDGKNAENQETHLAESEKPKRPKSMDVLESTAKGSPRIITLGSKDKDVIPSLNKENNEVKSPPAWQKEAVKKMAALSGFESDGVDVDKEDEDEENVKPSQPTVTPRRALPKPPALASGISTLKTVEGDSMKNVKDPDVVTARTRVTISGDEGKINIHGGAGESGVLGQSRLTVWTDHEQPVSKNWLRSGDTGPDVVLSHVEKNDKKFKGDEKGEGLKDKHTGVKDTEQQRASKDNSVAKDTKTDMKPSSEQASFASPKVTANGKVAPVLTAPLRVDNKNNNSMNNNKSALNKGHVSDMDHIKKLAQKPHAPLETVSLEDSSESSSDEKEEDVKKDKNGPQEIKSNVLEKDHEGEKKVEEQPTPTLRRKITYVGRDKKGSSESPSASPGLKKKIEVDTKFDFDKSSEYESSLTESTSRLSIHGKHTPPPRPPPPHPHHKVLSPKHISAIELQQQLLDIDSRLTDLELRGRDLEDSIRNVSVQDEEEDEELMMQWFQLVSEKNDLVRKEADLVYLSREQELESEQEHIESQLRYLMSKSDECKSPAEKEEEDYLFQRKIELVEQRNTIVDSMDEDRLRYQEEDRDIEVMLRGKGLWKDSAEMKALKGKKVARSKFYV